MTQLTARDVMTPDPVTVGPGLAVKEAARLMAEHRVGALPVMEGDRIVGLVTEDDLIMQDVKVEFPTSFHLLDGLLLLPSSVSEFEAELRKAVGATVADVMTSDPVTVDAGASMEDVATMMVDREVGRIPVLDSGRLVGIVSKSDLVRALASEE
ncbi:MAG: CBS domain-containing protein [Actinobacteria bacterium]|nr:MAG: CBS domain-containing protein [Actinomycetota bacterium]